MSCDIHNSYLFPFYHESEVAGKSYTIRNHLHWNFYIRLGLRPVVAQGHKRAIISATVVGLIPLMETKYLIFSFLHCSNEARRVSKCYHLTRNASRIRPKVGNGSVLMGTECLNLRFYIQREAQKMTDSSRRSISWSLVKFSYTYA